jgi:hypothetical protein
MRKEKMSAGGYDSLGIHKLMILSLARELWQQDQRMHEQNLSLLEGCRNGELAEAGRRLSSPCAHLD